MIRLLFLIVVFVLGLAGAVVFMGQMHHLRLAVPDRLPGWSAQIAEDAGLTRGTMELPATPHLPATVLSWRAVTPDADGWHWQLRLTGPGIALAARLTLPLWPERADIGDGSGSVDMAAIKGLPVDVAGLLTLEALTLTASPLRPAPSDRAAHRRHGFRQRAAGCQSGCVGQGAGGPDAARRGVADFSKDQRQLAECRVAA